MSKLDELQGLRKESQAFARAWLEARDPVTVEIRAVGGGSALLLFGINSDDVAGPMAEAIQERLGDFKLRAQTILTLKIQRAEAAALAEARATIADLSPSADERETEDGG